MATIVQSVSQVVSTNESYSTNNEAKRMNRRIGYISDLTEKIEQNIWN